MFSDVKSIKNVQRTDPLEHDSVKYSLKAVCSQAARLKGTLK